MKKLLEFSKEDQRTESGKDKKQNDIAIIGMSGAIGGTENIDEFFRELLLGKNFIKELSEERKKSNIAYIDWGMKQGLLKEDSKCFLGAFMNHIYDFDCEMFGISPREASLMEPNQRKFLEEAYHAIEDAGYGGEKIKGTNTGVFLGYSDDFFENYKHNIVIQDPSSYGLSLVGSIRSVIASRISYILDLKGPSVTYDTACSSSLIAIKEACIHLLNGECGMAIAGGVKIIQSPVNNDDWEINVQSKDNIAKTFDNSATGTGGGEGAIAFLLKPLKNAISDHDHIHAVIKGWSNNQDGRSIGITAPSPKAQEELMVNLLKNTGVNPEDISFVEAHGTGTKLGDPIEVSALTKAFKRYTNKKQFCALSSVKTNIGHLDCASGAAGVLKTVLCLKNKVLPPHLHFCKLNRQISLIDSPFYIPDEATLLTKQKKPHMAVVSSFGLSGTNCQILLEEAPEPDVVQKTEEVPAVLTISAKTETSIKQYITEHIRFLENIDEEDLDNYCYTINTGRGQYKYRCVVLFQTKEELIMRLKGLELDFAEKKDQGIFLGKGFTDDSVGEADKLKMDIEAKECIRGSKDMQKLCSLYVKGASIDWKSFYPRKQYRRISAPVYPYDRITCTNLTYKDEFDIRFITETCDSDIYSVSIRSFQWVVEEHKVDGFRVLPGTSYIQIILSLFQKFYHRTVEMKDLFFEHTLSFDEDECKELQITFHKDSKEVVAMSKSNDIWIKHAACKVEFMKEEENGLHVELADYISQAKTKQEFQGEDERKGFVSTGPRWNNINTIYYGDTYTLVELELQDRFEGDLDFYPFHPAMIDCAANVGKNRYSEEEYLPFRYEDIKIYGELQKKVYSILELKSDLEKSKELLTFDVTITDASGNILLKGTNYSIKRVKGKVVQEKRLRYYSMHLKPMPVQAGSITNGDTILIVGNQNTIASQIVNELARHHVQCITTEATKSIEEFTHILTSQKVKRILHLGAFSEPEEVTELNQLKEVQEETVLSLFRLAKAIYKSRIKDNIAISILGNKECYPNSVTAYGIGKVINKEFPNVDCRAIDFDKPTTIDKVIMELYTNVHDDIIYYKNNQRYIEELTEEQFTSEFEKPVLREEGVYLIPGGNGGMGLEIGKYLVRNGAKNIALLSRTNTIKAEEEQSFDELRKLCSQLNAEITSYQCDVSDFVQLKQTIEQVVQKYGNINGVIYCAGNAGDGVIINKELDAFENVMNVKVYGSFIMDKLLEGQKLDFVVLMSSITSITGEIGQSDYTAANYYLNCFAERKRKEGKNVIAIDWPAWKEVGMAAKYHVDSSKSMFLAIKNREAIEAFEEILGRSKSNLVPGTLNFGQLSTLLKQFNLSLSDDLSKHIPKEAFTHIQNTERKKIQVKGKESIDQIEREVAFIWGNVLQLSSIDVRDSFDKLGGDSIMVIRLLRELNSSFDNSIDMADIYTYSSVEQMAEYLRSKTELEVTEEEEDGFLDDILDKLEKGIIDVDALEGLMEERRGE